MKINFVKTIEPLVKSLGRSAVEVGDGMRYTLKDAKVAEDVFTRSANSCTSVVLNAGEHNLMAHIDPQHFNRTSFIDNFQKMVDNFQQKFGDAKAVIFGGWESGRVDPMVRTPSIDVYSTIAAVLDDMPLSMICGKRAGVASYDHLLANKNKITLANEAIERLKLTPEKIKTMTPEAVENELQKLYEWVEIEPSMLDKLV